MAPGSRARMALLMAGVERARSTSLVAGTQPWLGGCPADFQGLGLFAGAGLACAAGAEGARGLESGERPRTE
eukprot:13988924-Alexandrium_andersonii.AAC.1